MDINNIDINKIDIEELKKQSKIIAKQNHDKAYNNPLYEYIIEVANNLWGDSTIPVGFYLNCRNGLINTEMPESYLNDIDIQDTLRAFHLDVEKFWYLCVFILDVVEGFMTDTVEEITPMDELISLCNALSKAKPMIPKIDKIFESGDWCPIESNSVLSVKVGNKNIFSITNQSTLRTIQYILQDFIQNHRTDEYLNDSSFTAKRGKINLL